MKLIDFFDFDNDEHIEAFRTVLATNRWPKEFYDHCVTHGVEFDTMNIIDLCLAFTMRKLEVV